ncbi:MAG: ATP-binding protein [Candidatus Aenigmarchaeota archaeon]|nr:ATP-binding protein [Candidatus Aenigmarchaeota archaeon]
MEVGAIISFNGPSTNEFWFVVKKDVEIKKHQYVQLQTKEGLLVGRIEELEKANKYFSNPETVSEFENYGRNLNEQFPVDRWEYLIAKVRPLGVFVDGEERRVTIPPSPSTKVYLADNEILKRVFGFDDNGLSVGIVEHHNLEAKLNITRLFKKHLAILGISGSGKSHLSNVLIEELLSREDSPAIIVIDPHGEYTVFSQDERFSHKTKVWNKENISFATYKISANSFAELIPEMSAAQRRDLAKIIDKLREKKKVYDLSDLIKEVENSDIKQNVKDALVSWLEDLNSSGLFSNVDKPSLQELARVSGLSVIDLSSFIHLKEKQIVVTRIARSLFEARRAKMIPPFIIVIEEAHQFAPEREEVSMAISRSVIEQIAREGRKFFASLVLISQRPIKLSTTALSQCNTHIILRITNPYDLQHIEESSEGITAEIAKAISGLKVGEAFIVGEAVNFPVLIKVRKRSIKAVKEVTLEEEIKEFKEKKQEYIDFFFS